MLSSVLNSERAIQVNTGIMRVFVNIRKGYSVKSATKNDEGNNYKAIVYLRKPQQAGKPSKGYRDRLC